jgi:hypothetical protein
MMNHISTNSAAAAPSTLVQAAFSAADDAECHCPSLQEAEVYVGAIVRHLLLAAAQQDSAATAAAVHGKLQSLNFDRKWMVCAASFSFPRVTGAPQLKRTASCLSTPDDLVKLSSCVAQDLWLCSDADLAALEAQWPAVQQQMLSIVAKARHEPQEGDEAAALSQ